MFLSLFFISCSVDQKRRADIEVRYGKDVVYRAYADYNTEQDLRNALNTEDFPHLIIFSAPWCAACKQLQSKINSSGMREKVIILNLQENWVKYLAGALKIRGIPALVVIKDSGHGSGAIFYGPLTIERILNYETR